ncbi:MAG: hypothetical protein LBV41_08400 [Cytophagaceae bacterium]|jgi:hypothetical protein|nr:hypothetical protein [Cytophagaceae bacterium]
MKIHKFSIFCLFFVFIGTINNEAQCIAFARGVAKPKILPFVHDGNYNATFIEEGESAELYKTFFEGQTYRLVVAATETLPKNIRIRILNEQRKVMFDNAEHGYVYVWDFEAQTSETLIVHAKVPEGNPESPTIAGGCLAIMFGIKSDVKRK